MSIDGHSPRCLSKYRQEIHSGHLFKNASPCVEMCHEGQNMIDISIIIMKSQLKSIGHFINSQFI